MSRQRPPFQLLEINIISAQDLASVSKSMRSYAVAWVHPRRKLSTRIDSIGHNNPTWNDKFVFRVDDEFLRKETSAVMIDIYSQHWFRDTNVGSVRILVGNLIPPPTRKGQPKHMGLRFMALQVRRPSGRPQGILNIGVALLDSSMRSMPLYSQLSSSALGFPDLIGEDDPEKKTYNYNYQNPITEKKMLRRTNSERSELRVSEAEFSDIPASTVHGSEVMDPQKKNGKNGKGSSALSGMETGGRSKGKVKSGKASPATSGKASSVMSGSDFMDVFKKKLGPEAGYPVMKGRGSDFSMSTSEMGESLKVKTKGKTGSSIYSSDNRKVGAKPFGLDFGSKASPRSSGVDVWSPSKGGLKPPFKLYDYGGPKHITTGSMLSDSEVGPSPSEVAAAIANDRYRQGEDWNNSAVDGWSLGSSEEGLRSKLERWRTELPPLYDRSDLGSYRSTSGHIRRYTEANPEGSGLFSCFGSMCGYECSIVCGGSSSSSSIRKIKSSSSVRPQHSPSPSLSLF